VKKDMAGLVVWITGASSGIGRALAVQMASRGATVAVSARRVERLSELVDELNAKGQEARAFPCDVTNRAAVFSVAAQIADAIGRIDVVVANAGFGVQGAFIDVTPDAWKRQMDVNLFGVIWTLQAAIPYLIKTKGRAAVISSISGLLAFANTSAYSASKFALVGLCNSLYQELHASGVSVTNIMPGFVHSEITQVDSKGVFHEAWKDPRPSSLVWSAESAAKKITHAIMRRKREAVITGHAKVAAFMVRFLPALTYWLLARRPISRRYARRT